MLFENPKRNEVLLVLFGKRYIARLDFYKLAQFEAHIGTSFDSWVSSISQNWLNINQSARLFQLATGASYLRCLIATLYNGGNLFESLVKATIYGIPDNQEESTSSDDTDFVQQLMELALNPERLGWSPDQFWSSSINEVFSAIREQTKPSVSFSDDEISRLDAMMGQ